MKPYLLNAGDFLALLREMTTFSVRFTMVAGLHFDPLGNKAY